jgi:hypothetical protein
MSRVAFFLSLFLCHSGVTLAESAKSSGKSEARSSSQTVKISLPDGQFLDSQLPEADFIARLSQVISDRTKQNVAFAIGTGRPECAVVYRSAFNSPEWPNDICITNNVVKSFSLAGKQVENTTDVFTVMAQLYAEFPETKRRQNERMEKSELSSVLKGAPTFPGTDFFGKAIVQPSGMMLEFGVVDLCRKLARTHRNLRWYKTAREQQFYLVMNTLTGETLGMLFDTNKINVGTDKEPEYVLTNQIVKAWMHERSIPEDDLIRQFKPLEALKLSDADRCPGADKI